MQDNSALGRALAMVRDLRTRCPWDRAQTRETLRPYLVEEVLELDHALGEGEPDADPRRAERPAAPPGLSARDRARSGASSPPDDVADGLERKMRRRHPHLFDLGDAEPWERIKRKERAGPDARGHRPDPAAAAQGLPAAGARGVGRVRLARRRGPDARRCGRSWRRWRPSWQRAGPSAARRRPTRTRPRRPPSDALVEEIGDLLFAVVNLARKAGVQPGPALDRRQPEVPGSVRGDRAAGGGARDRDARRGAGGAGRAVGRGEGRRAA